MTTNSQLGTRRSRGAWLASASLALLSLVASAAMTGCGDGGSNYGDPSYDDSPSDDDRYPAYTIEFYVESASVFGALQLEITHLGNSGGFIGRGDRVDCVALVDAIVASNYLGERTTKIGVISLSGIATPSAIMRCGFRTKEELTPDDFAVDVTDAADVRSNPIDPAPTVVISSITER